MGLGPIQRLSAIAAVVLAARSSDGPTGSDASRHYRLGFSAIPP
jgi:hypothetical protein